VNSLKIKGSGQNSNFNNSISQGGSESSEKGRHPIKRKESPPAATLRNGYEHGVSKRWTGSPNDDKLETKKQAGKDSLQKNPMESDVEIGRDLGAKAKNYAVMDLTTGEFFQFSQGTKIQNVEIFAGQGTKKEFRKAQKYADRYGGTPEDWQHAKGHGIIETPEGDRKAEVHWVQCSGVGKFDFFVKRWEDE